MRWLLIACGLFLSLPAWAVKNVSVVALFKDRVVLLIDGRQQALSVGQTSPEGVRLISASSKEAVLEVNGKPALYRLSNQVGTNYAKRKENSVQIARDPRGMYRVNGNINNFAVRFLVDTGATHVAMNVGEAKRLGIEYRVNGRPMTVFTASGNAQGYQVRLDKVKVGDIELRAVEGLVVEGGFPTEALLGMSFLGRLDMQNTGQTLVLKQAHF
jgi:aspartyl protease family protein